MKKTVIVNIYNCIRMSHVEPSRFISDDFETLKKQLILVKQYGFPGTYALKYDALMESRYQVLLREYLDENDEISAWWEITAPLCRAAGVRFRGGKTAGEYDDRVDSAYSVGYDPAERKRLVDAYMVDFHNVFGRYPQTMGSWVLDSVTLQYAAERYGVVGGAICRDQMGVDGFTLWGGYPNGMYYPSRKNEFIPGQSPAEQLPVPMFRLLGPDPIYNFEADVRPGLQGVYTLEPSWLTGRDPRFISWLFASLTEEDTLGIGYAHVGQENNFLWENIQPGFEPQLRHVQTLCRLGKLRVETMAQSARWFRQQYSLTPALTFQASSDWDGLRNLSAQWYASANYRIGFLGEAGHLRIRDLFLYRQDYPSRYLEGSMKGTKSVFDAPPVLFPQIWGGVEDRPYIRLIKEEAEPRGRVVYRTLEEDRACAELLDETGNCLARFTMTPEKLLLTGQFTLRFDRLPVLTGIRGREVQMEHQGFAYGFRVDRGQVKQTEAGLEIAPEAGEIVLILGPKLGETRRETDVPLPRFRPSKAHPVPPLAPEAVPGDAVFAWGMPAKVELRSHDAGVIRYTLDGSEPDENAPIYDKTLELRKKTTLKARLFCPDGRRSQTMEAAYWFGYKELTLDTRTELDTRPVFRGGGLNDLLKEARGTLNYLDGRWRGTLEDLDVTAELKEAKTVRSISMGFLSHHRSGIVLPESVTLYLGADRDHLVEVQKIILPCTPLEREIAKQDVVFQVNAPVGAFRLVAKRYERMPQWCCYHGSTTVFTMVDNLIVE